MRKIYLAHSISTRGEFEDSKRVAKEIESTGFSVYAAANNLSINDKTNDPTPLDIYEGDIREIKECDIFVVNIDGNLQTGTISEVGFVSGYNDVETSIGGKPIKVVGYTSNARLAQPQFHKGIPSAHANHLVLGMIEKWGEFVGSEADMISKLTEMIRKKLGIKSPSEYGREFLSGRGG